MTMRFYHYTVGHKLPAIAATGALIPTGEKIGPRERRVLWFSLHQQWEPTATKMFLRPGGRLYTPTVAELHESLGLYRFIAPTNARLLPWSLLRAAAHISHHDATLLIGAGLALGARPSDWYGTMEPVAVGLMTVEAWDGSTWNPTTLPDAIASSPARRRTVISAIAP